MSQEDQVVLGPVTLASMRSTIWDVMTRGQRQDQYTRSSVAHGLTARAASRSIRYPACDAVAATRNNRVVPREALTAATGLIGAFPTAPATGSPNFR